MPFANRAANVGSRLSDLRLQQFLHGGTNFFNFPARFISAAARREESAWFYRQSALQT
jgi:hypothetical protein